MKGSPETEEDTWTDLMQTWILMLILRENGIVWQRLEKLYTFEEEKSQWKEQVGLEKFSFDLNEFIAFIFTLF